MMDSLKMIDSLNAIYGLCFECPFYNEKDDCIFKFLRMIENIHERIEILQSLNEQEKRRIYSLHLECLHRRECNINANKINTVLDIENEEIKLFGCR